MVVNIDRADVAGDRQDEAVHVHVGPLVAQDIVADISGHGPKRRQVEALGLVHEVAGHQVIEAAAGNFPAGVLAAFEAGVDHVTALRELGQQ